VLDVEVWAEIRRLHRAEGLPIREIARVMGVPGNTVRAAVASDGPPKYERPRAGSVVDVVEPRIRELLRAYPAMPATVIAERIGWERSIRVLSGWVAEPGPHRDRPGAPGTRLVPLRCRGLRPWLAANSWRQWAWSGCSESAATPPCHD
jgi:transposase